MSVAPDAPELSVTEHALLVPLGRFAQEIGLIDALRRVPFPMKTVQHQPGDKLATVLIHILAGGMHINELQTSPHPLLQDPVVAQAWDQQRFASASGISALLQAATEESVAELKQELDGVIATDRAHLLRQLSASWLVVDLDLTGLVVSSQARTYEGADFGYMGELGHVGKGYQFARAQVQGPGERIQLGGFLHPGHTVSLECVTELVTLVEATLGRPRRRTEAIDQRLATAEGAVARAEQELAIPTRSLRKQQCRERRLAEARAKATQLQERRAALEQENAASPCPPRIILRMDGAFGTPANLTWLWEQGYSVVTRGYNQQITRWLRREDGQHWEHLSANSWIAAATRTVVDGCPYSMRLFLCRQEAGRHRKERWSSLVVTPDLAPTGWSVRRVGEFYNQRQDMEAGIKESKAIFASRHLPTRHGAGIALYQDLVLFAQNLLRWFRRQVLLRTPLATLGCKDLVHAAAKCRALVIWSPHSLVLQFVRPGRWAGLTLTLVPTCTYQLWFTFLEGVPGSGP